MLLVSSNSLASDLPFLQLHSSGEPDAWIPFYPFPNYIPSELYWWYPLNPFFLMVPPFSHHFYPNMARIHGSANVSCRLRGWLRRSWTCTRGGPRWWSRQVNWDMEVSWNGGVPSGKHTKSDIENGPLKIVDLWIYPLKSVIFDSFFQTFTRGYP